MKIMQVKFKAGDLSKNKYGQEVDKERAVLPTLIYAGDRMGNDRLIVLGTGWWKWGARLIVHLRFK